MKSKENILERIAEAQMPEYPYPDFAFRPQHFEDRTATFAERLRAAGGEVVEKEAGEKLDDVIGRCYPWARNIVSNLPEVTVSFNPDDAADARELVDVELGVVDGLFGVAENGAVWVRQDIRSKALYFGATALMIVIPREALVDTMHEAVEWPDFRDFSFGCFISGPSKTADIEQALVFGAHGPMSVTIVLC